MSSDTTIKDFISFIPMEEHPSFIIEGLSENVNLSELILNKCIKDLELVQNMDKISANWKVHGPGSQFITSYRMAVHYSCSSQEICNETILFRRNVEKTFSSSILTGPLRDGVYRVSIKPCFGDICSKSWKSDGFYIEKFDMNIGRLSASFDLLDNECPVVNIKFQRFACSVKVKNYAVFYKWAFFGDNKGEKQLTAYKSVEAAVNATISVSTCVHLPVYPHGELYLCVKGFCESGLSSLQCSRAWIKQHPNEFPKSIVYDLNLKTLPMKNLDDYRFTSTIGSDMIKTLHKYEMDFTNESRFQLGGFTIGTGRNHVQWTVMTEKRFPTDCLTDVSCIYQEITLGGFARFPTYLSLRTGEIYYLCVNITKGCSDGFVFDNVPPSSGNVKVHTHHNGYINSNSTVTLLWHGFVDGSHFQEFLYPSAIERYEMAIGTHLNSQDVLSFKHIGLSESSVLANVSLFNGMTYYFFIRAFDHAGNYITSPSDPYIFDSTPPTTGMVTVGSYMKSLKMVNPGNLIAHWSGMEDRESGIEKYEIGIWSFDSQISSYYSLNKNTYAYLADYLSFVDGHQYRIILKAWNNAGLYTTVSSAPFIFDASPPLVGIVRDGPLETEVDLMFSSNVSSLSIHWTNFHDPHSMISNYLVGLGTAFKRTNIIPMTDVGLRKEWIWFKSFRTGVKYFATVESCNKAGLCSGASSNGIILDDSPPIPGRVLVGRNNDRYVPDSKTLSVSWVDFIEAESGILQYFVCLGSKKFICDVESWKNNRHESSILLFNLNLPQNQSIYATVKAENKAGLTSSASSDTFFVDVTPPIVVFPPNVIKTNSPIELYDLSLLKIQWNFKDNESPLAKGLISFRTSHNGKLLIDDIAFYGDETRTISLDTSKWLSSGDKYRIVVTSCNAARLCTSSESDEITIDSTPPLVGHILDNAIWSNNDLLVMLKWKDFVDPETKVVAYYLHLSETLYGREISGQTIKVPHDGGVYEEQKVTVNITRNLVQNEKMLLGLSATNNVGLNSKARHVTFLVLPTKNNMSQGRLLIEKHSCDSLSCTNDCTCSTVGKKCSYNIGIMQCRESNFTMKPLPHIISDGLESQSAYSASTRCLSSFWNSTSDMIRRYEWSVGIEGFPIGYGVFDLQKENPWKDIGLDTQFVYCLPPGKQFKHMHSYVIFLRSWITATDYAISESKPVTIDTSPPQINRGKTIKDSFDNCATHSHTGKSFHALTTCWDGVFSDQQSGIKKYNLFVGTVPGGHDVSGILNIGLELNFTWHLSNLHPGVKYFSTIQAVNNVGLQTTLFSSGILIDNTSPSVGIVYNTAFFQNIPWHPFLTSLTATWQGFKDHDSFISSYFVALVDSGGNVIKDFENVGIQNKHTLSNLTLDVQKQYIFLVKAQNSVGLKSNAVRSHQISFDVSKPKGMECKLYSQVIYNLTISSIAKVNFISEQINVTKGQYRFKVQIHTLNEFRHDSIHVFIEDTNHEIPTDDLENGFLYLSSTEKTVNVLVDITTLRTLNDNFTIRLTGEKCLRLEEANGNAVTVRQISPSHVIISAFIVDEESEITSVDVLVGTIRNAQQIARFSMHTGIFARTIHILQQQATPITVSVFAKNGAGLQENLYALPIALDHTAPVLVVKEVFVSYKTENTEVKSIFTIRWHVEEKESDIQECFCALGSIMGSDTIIPWFESENRTECRSLSMRLPHGTEVFASVKCVNTIGLSSEVNEKNFTIVAYKAPIATQPEVTFAVNSMKMMLLEHIQHSTTSLHFHWLRFQDVTGLINYNFCIKSDNNIVLNSADIGKHNYVSIDDLDLQYNGTYISDVYAVNSVGKRSDLINGSIKVLDIAPIQTGKICNISMGDGKLNVTWNGVFQLDPRIEYSYTVFIGSQAGYADIVRSMNTKDDSVIVQTDFDIQDVFIVITAEYAGRFRSTYREHKQIL